MNDRIRIIFFDLDHTLVFRRPDSFDVISACCTRIGQPIDPEAERRGRRLEHWRFAEPAIRDRFARLPQEEFWLEHNRHLLDTMGVVGDLDDLSRQITASYIGDEHVYDCPPVVGATLAEIRGRGYRLGLITNRESVDRLNSLLDATSLRPLLDLAVASGELGIRKPAPGIFHVALTRAGVAAEQALYVGDNYYADVVGAQGAGMTPVLVDPHHLFPEAPCLVVERIDELPAWLPWDILASRAS